MDLLRLCCLLLLLGASGATRRQRRQQSDAGSEKRCECKDGQGICYCVDYGNCDPATNYVRTEGETIIQPRLDEEELLPDCTGQGNGLEVCCHGPADEPEEPDEPVDKPSTKRGCGVRKDAAANTRILGGVGTSFGEDPWMAAVLTTSYTVDEFPNGTVFNCGASLLSHQVAVTAAHCIFNRDPSDLLVRAGDWDLSAPTEPIPHQERAVRQVLVHPDYRSDTLLNDVALLVLAQPLRPAANIGPVCLPAPEALFTGSRCLVTGWGINKEEGGNYQNVLKRTELPVIDSRDCQRQLQTTKLSRFFRLHGSFICAGGESDMDTCLGDGGGPLMCPSDRDPDRLVQAGIVSWGIGCGRRKLPGVYTNLAIFTPWIDSEMAKLGLTNESKEP